MTIVVSSGSFSLLKIVDTQEMVWFVIPFLPTFLLFFISSLAETSRIPFDFPEAESELVSGYNTEYSSVTFVLFFLSEYCHIILMSALLVLMFFGGWNVFTV
jgi:NADH:ubiquinone oxidoreductase subunit H